MNSPPAQLAWLDSQRPHMQRLLLRWASINSYTHNLPGLAQFASEVEAEFNSLGGQLREHPVPQFDSIDSNGHLVHSPLGKVISIVKRPTAPLRILLCIHLDTVYPLSHPFQKVTRVDDHIYRGPGVADAKGGLIVMLFALRMLEQTPLAERIGWEVLLNPDEEIGSVGSAALLTEAAKRNHVGLVFEPSLPDGSLVGARKGSGNFTVVVRGVAAHAGRDFHLGRSAILALADFINKLDAAQSELPGVIINCGKIEGGGALNVVPDLAIGRFNVRITHPNDQQLFENKLNELIKQLSQRDGIRAQVHGSFTAPPKSLDPKTVKLFDLAQQCGKEIGLNLQIHPSGGTCDGNRLATAGLPVIDTLGPRGGHLHSAQEYLLIDSLVERAKLTALLMMKLAESWPGAA